MNEGMYTSIKNHILHSFKELKTLCLRFIGSIALYAKEYISNQLNKKGLNVASDILRHISNFIK
jgi:hypothetical protein